jgi:hypothetical protein
LASNAQRERRLSILGTGDLAALSDDGGTVLFIERLPEGVFSYIRTTDGAPPANLGPGTARALSPDQKWALAVPDFSDDALSLLPVGAGQGRSLRVPGFVAAARFLHDQKRIAFIGLSPESKEMSLYVMLLDTGASVRISPAITPGSLAISGNDHLAAVRGIDDVVTIFPIDGGLPTRLPELGTGLEPLVWTASGDLWVGNLRDVPSHLSRFDIKRRRIVEERNVGPSDPTGVLEFDRLLLTPDGRATAFVYQRDIGRLLLMDGMVPGRR